MLHNEDTQGFFFSYLQLAIILLGVGGHEKFLIKKKVTVS